MPQQVDINALNTEIKSEWNRARWRNRLFGVKTAGIHRTVTISMSPQTPGLGQQIAISGQVLVDGIPLIESKAALLVDGQVVATTRITRTGYSFQYSFAQFGKHTIQVSSNISLIGQEQSDEIDIDIEPVIKAEVTPSSVNTGQGATITTTIRDNIGVAVKAPYTISVYDPSGTVYMEQTRLTNPSTGQDMISLVPHTAGDWPVKVVVAGRSAAALLHVTEPPPPPPSPPPGTQVPSTYTPPPTLPAPVTVQPPPPVSTVPVVTPPAQTAPQTPGGGTVTITSAVASPSSGNAPLAVVFTGTFEGGIQPYTHITWDFGDGITVEDANAEKNNLLKSTVSHVYNRPGTYQVQLIIEDGYYDTTTSNPVTVQVGEAGIVVTVSADPQQGPAPLSTTLRAGASGGVAPYYLQWSYGDGTPIDTQSGAQTVHIYQNNGLYTATAIVMDSNGVKQQGGVQVTVGPTTIPPSAFTVSMPLASFQNGVINVVGAASDSANMDAIVYMVVSLLTQGGALIGTQRRQTTIYKGQTDQEGFIFNSPGSGLYFVTIQLWADPNGTTKLGMYTTKSVTVP